MLDAVIAFIWPEGMARYTFAGGGGHAAGNSVRDLVFQTADGYITVGAVSDAEWTGLARAAGHPEWIDDPRFKTPRGRAKYVDQRLELTQEALRSKSSAQWLARFDAEDVPCAPILSREDLFRDQQIAANELIVESVHPHAGAMRQPRPAVRYDATPTKIERPAPMLGEHTDEVLGEIGISGEKIAQLRQAGVIG